MKFDEARDLPAYRVTTDTGHSWVTSMAKDITLDDAKKYFLGKDINVGSGGEDKVEKVVKVEQVKEALNVKLNENHLKPLADALLPYSYVVRHYDEKTMVLRAGNGTEVKFETVSMKPVKATLSSEGDEWAIRQVADLLQNHPAFVFTKESQGEVPWTIEFKESATENFQAVRDALLG